MSHPGWVWQSTLSSVLPRAAGSEVAGAHGHHVYVLARDRSKRPWLPAVQHIPRPICLAILAICGNSSGVLAWRQ